MGFGETHGTEDTVLPDIVFDVLSGRHKQQEEGQGQRDQPNEHDEEVEHLHDVSQVVDQLFSVHKQSQLRLKGLSNSISHELSVLSRYSLNKFHEQKLLGNAINEIVVSVLFFIEGGVSLGVQLKELFEHLRVLGNASDSLRSKDGVLVGCEQETR